MIRILYLVLTSAISFIIAANNSAGSIGTLYGSRITSYYKSALFAGTLVMLGTFLEGWKMSGAIGGGMIENPLTIQMSLLVLFSTALLLLIFTVMSIPLSASQILVGSILGVATFYAIGVNTEFVGYVVMAWAINFLASMALAFITYISLAAFSKHRNIFAMSKFYTISLLISSGFIAYTLGANTIGLIASLDLSTYSILIAGMSAMAGTVMLGKRTVITVGSRITNMDPPRAFSAQIGGAIIVEIFTQFHFPVSITQAIIGGVIGTGVVKGYKELNHKTIKNLLLSWLLAPISAFVLTYIIVRVIPLHL